MGGLSLRQHRGRGRWTMDRAAAHAALLGMEAGSEWALIWNEQAVRQKVPAELFLKRASDPEDRMYSFKVNADEARLMVGFTFELFGCVVDEPATPLYWHLDATGGLEHELRIEVWWLEVPLRTGLRALRTHEPLIGADRKVIEVTGPEWEGGIDRARSGLRALDMKIAAAGGAPRKERAAVLDELANLGIKWLGQHEATWADVQERHLAEADVTSERAIYGRRSRFDPTISMPEIRERIRQRTS